MKKDLFKTPKEQEIAVAEFKELIEHRGWKRYVQVVDFYIRNLSQRLESGEGDTIEAVNRLRDSIVVHKADKSVPTQIIEEFSSNDPDVVRDDPYYQPEDFIEKPKK